MSNPPLLRIRPPRGFGSILASTTLTTALAVAGAQIPYTSVLTDNAASVIAKLPCCAGSNDQSQPAVSGAVPVAILEPSFSARQSLSKTFGHIRVGPGLFCELCLFFRSSIRTTCTRSSAHHNLQHRGISCTVCRRCLFRLQHVHPNSAPNSAIAVLSFGDTSITADSVYQFSLALNF